MRPASAPANLGSVAARRPPAPAATTSAAPPRVSTAQAAPVAVPAPVAPASPLTAAATAGLAGKLEGLGLTRDQVAAVLSLSREVVEQAVWEVVPILAETLIKEEIARLTAE
jgi:predicted flap endonuclease-1-like 5' DNA nuclease